MPSENARRSAELLVLADVWGIGSHGLLRLPYYLARFAAGGMNAAAELRLVNDTGPVLAYDGGDGLGHWQVWQAAEASADRARQYGLSVASVRASAHCGCLGAYTLPGLRHGLITLVFSTGPAVMAPPGTATPVLSTSPLAAGIPCRPHPAVVDLATSAVARGRIAEHAKRGEPLPTGWAVDAQGTPTTNPAAALAGMLAPLGGGKGFALAFLVEALTGALVGPNLAVDVPDMFDHGRDADPQRIAHLVLTLDPDTISGGPSVDADATAASAAERLDALAAHITQAGGRIPGATRRLPWELADDTPVQVRSDVLTELTDLK